MINKEALKRTYSIVRALGLDPLLLRNPLKIPAFIADTYRWTKGGGHVDSLYVCLEDKGKPAGHVPKHYFRQDIHVARKIFEAKPPRHIDIGSRIDGFVAHLACFREVELWDFRSVDLGVPYIKTQQKDLTRVGQDFRNTADSVSCLHVLEHIGLGRYGDTIDPDGHIKAFRNLVDLIKPDGTLYVSFPVSTSPRIEFNAHRVFGLSDILAWDDRIRIESFAVIDDQETLHENLPPSADLGPIYYGCGIYVVKKK